MKTKIITKSIELFERNGFTETSVQHIVDALHVTKGTFYYYFDSKEALLMEIHLAYIDDLLQRQTTILTQQLSVKEKIKAIISLLIFDIERQGKSAQIFLKEIRHLVAENGEKIKAKRNAFRLNIEHLIQQGIENKELKQTLRADTITFAILGISNYSYNWFNPQGEITPLALVDSYVEIILNGISNDS